MFPRLLTIGDYSLPTYGVLVATAFAVGLLIAMRLSARSGLDGNRVFDMAVYTALAALAGAKIFYVLEDWGFYSAHPREIFSLGMLQAGGTFYGGFLAAVAMASWYIRRHGMPFLKTADAFVPGVSLGHAIGRLGCFSAGCCWGRPTTAAWAVTFTDPYAQKIVGVPLGVPLHPTQLYEALAEALIFAMLLAAWKRKSFDGQVLSLYLVLYGVARFLIEFVRDHPEGLPLGGPLSASQWVAVVLVPAGVALWVLRRPASANATLVSRASGSDRS